MCRNIRTLFNFDPPATEDEVRASALQFVRKLSGFAQPSKANQAAFDRAVADVSATARRLLDSLVTSAEPRDRETEAARAKAKSALRFTPVDRRRLGRPPLRSSGLARCAIRSAPADCGCERIPVHGSPDRRARYAV